MPFSGILKERYGWWFFVDFLFNPLKMNKIRKLLQSCLMLFLAASSCVPGEAWAYDLVVERERAMNWVHARRNGTNWVAVGEGSDIGYTYDNALMMIAYTAARDFINARDLLNFLQAYQLADGSWYDGMQQTTGAGVALARSSGNQAWVLYAICFYTYQTGDRSYLPMAEEVASWLIARQDTDGGITGGISASGTERTWTSTEHNLDAYFAFKLLYHLTANAPYRDARDRCKNWLLQVAWNNPEGRFNRGEDDPVKTLDANSWGSLFLDDIGDSPKQASVIAHIEASYSITTVRQHGQGEVTYTGFREKVQDETGYGQHWQEGTVQMAVAYLRVEQPNVGVSYVEEVIKSDDPAFAIGHRDEDNDGDGGKQYFLTGSATTNLIEKPPAGLWQIFAINEYLGDRSKVFFPISPSRRTKPQVFSEP